jgi:outer membrane receptor protein involved in Fe transport
VPRAGVHKAFENWHYKLMGSQSYRVPSGIHQDRVHESADRLKPEIATNYEAEVGYNFSEKLSVSVNLFDIKINDPIIWNPDIDDGIYYNGGTFGTRGAEGDLRYVYGKYELFGNIAYYQRAHYSFNSLEVPGENRSYLNMPNWRVNLMPGYKITRNFGIFPSATYESRKWGYTGAGNEELRLTSEPDAFYFNLNARYNDVFFRGLDMSLGIMNLTNEVRTEFMPYNSGFAGVPGLSRAVNLMISYSANF